MQFTFFNNELSKAKIKLRTLILTVAEDIIVD